MTTSLVVAASTNNAIGKNNELLWRLPNDMRFFKNITWGMPVAYGRKTFESLCSKPLNGRMNIVITRQKDIKGDGIVSVGNLRDAEFLAAQNDYKELMILGGGEIYKEAIKTADKIYITRVHHIFEDADTFFPVIDESTFKLTSNQDFFKDTHHAYDYSFQVWERL
ncbi:dihydrofolate reductase [Danxiaibacter flavus]|uniref:Dihydrofolate reductase n=1 Tax=Danxiaibacter flavus TaxID=3049108 RepID=A0ABV3ZHP7_9BACT|nr:dihydrofolate reductase [Chitinophagaceae bacterium DXS]